MFRRIQYMNNNRKPNGVRAPIKSRKPKSSASKRAGAQKPQVSKANIAMARAGISSPPKLNSTQKGSHVNHRELIGTVNGSIAFTANKFVCNPGMPATFPWLSGQAAQWEQYRFNRLRFRYLTRTATTTVGSIIMAPDYDPSDSPPASELAVSTYQDCVEDAVWVQELVCDLNVDSMFPNGRRKFVRSGSVGQEDLKLYDAANFFLCTLEQIGASAIGKLWVEYDVDFFTPQTPGASAASSSRFLSRYVDQSTQALATGVAEPLLFSDLVVDPLGIGTPAAGVFTPAAGSYRIEAQCSVLDTGLANGVFSVQLEVLRNGASLPAASRSMSISNMSGAEANARITGICDSYLVCDGSDTFQVQITATTDSGGVLTVIAGSQSLAVLPA